MRYVIHTSFAIRTLLLRIHNVMLREADLAHCTCMIIIPASPHLNIDDGMEVLMTIKVLIVSDGKILPLPPSARWQLLLRILWFSNTIFISKSTQRCPGSPSAGFSKINVAFLFVLLPLAYYPVFSPVFFLLDSHSFRSSNYL